ncbi:phosphoglycolate phosphatase [Luteimonas sp. e5]
MSRARRFPEVVLFDLDGTLLDSAPDMLATVNVMRARRDMPPMTLAAIRPFVSRGARAMSGAAFPAWGEDEILAAVPEFLDVYAGELGRHGAPFAGIEELLRAIEDDGGRWGIVTNKPEGLARDLLPMLGWEQRSSILVGGDSLAERKPHPLPLLHSANELGVSPAQCAYVGDDRRDIQSARAAGMPSIVALWGYRMADDDPAAWGGDVLVAEPADLLHAEAWP